MPELAIPPERQWEELRLLGRSSPMIALRREIVRCARTSSPILIIGEAGTGKENVASACRLFSRRAGQPFVKVNCSGLTESLIETELFGHVKGAFTGAISDKLGRFQAANGGTIFLDEVGTLPSSTQVKLLRVLQENTIERVGDYSPLTVDVRVIAATNENLEEALRSGRLRKDFYTRIAHLVIEVPPLRDRDDDILLLAEKFLVQAFADASLERKNLSDSVPRKLITHKWPGNVRELQAVVARAVTLVEPEAGSVGETCIVFDNRLSAAPTLSGEAPGTDVVQGSVREAVAQETLDLLLRREEPLRGLRRGSKCASELVDLFIRGVVDGALRYLDTPTGQHLRRNLSSQGILDRLGLSSRSGNQSLLARQITSALKTSLSKVEQGESSA